MKAQTCEVQALFIPSTLVCSYSQAAGLGRLVIGHSIRFGPDRWVLRDTNTIQHPCPTPICCASILLFLWGAALVKCWEGSAGEPRIAFCCRQATCTPLYPSAMPLILAYCSFLVTSLHSDLGGACRPPAWCCRQLYDVPQQPPADEGSLICFAGLRTTVRREPDACQNRFTTGRRVNNLASAASASAAD